MSVHIAVVDYGIGNLRSAEKALQHVGADAALTDRPADVDAADAVVLPGVGAFGRCVEALHDAGLADAVVRAGTDGRPFLGICVGMQMLYEGSDETPDVAGLGLLSGRVVRLPDGVKRPQMQWNRLDHGQHPMFAGEAGRRADGETAWVYFVHSFAAERTADTVATTTYGTELVAAAARGPVWATQFHPEKSGRAGLAMLDNFRRAASGEER